MAKIGYLLAEPKSEREDIKKLEEHKCEIIYKDTIKEEATRPKFNNMLSNLKRGDELFLISFHNAVRGPRQLCMLLEMCRVQRIRLVSVRDQIDSWEDLYESTIENVLNVIGALPGDAMALRIAGERIDMKKNKLKTKGVKTEREQKCVKMYQEGYLIEEIQKETGFSSKSSVFRILKKHGVEFTRKTGKNNRIATSEEQGKN